MYRDGQRVYDAVDFHRSWHCARRTPDPPTHNAAGVRDLRATQPLLRGGGSASSSGGGGASGSGSAGATGVWDRAAAGPGLRILYICLNPRICGQDDPPHTKMDLQMHHKNKPRCAQRAPQDPPKHQGGSADAPQEHSQIHPKNIPRCSPRTSPNTLPNTPQHWLLGFSLYTWIFRLGLLGVG